MAYNQQNFDRPQGSGISIVFALILALLTGLGGFVAGYYINAPSEIDPRDMVRNVGDSDYTDTLVTEPIIDSFTPSRVDKVNTDSIRQQRMMKR